MLFFDNNKKRLKLYEEIVEEINSRELNLENLTDNGLRKKTKELKKRLNNGETLDDILFDAYALVREAAKRVIGLRHYDVQLIGGAILHHGNIAEMKTGEGKTLVETLPAFLNALEGKGVHIITVNDYLAKRDKENMGPIFEFLGLSVGLIQSDMESFERKINYSKDITYVTNTQIGFDYLKDNMVKNKEEKVLRGFNYAIIDEVDSILIDEARTPLIITSLTEPKISLYSKANAFSKTVSFKEKIENSSKFKRFEKKSSEEVVDYDVLVNKKDRSATLTELGVSKAEKFFEIENLSDPENSDINHHIQNALKARFLFRNNYEYIVVNGKIEIVDEHTGRILKGRMYSDGIHQAIECKENCQISPESKTLATVTYQNFFKMYSKISGMTGTAKTEEEEFQNIYKMHVIEVPTNKPIARNDLNDIVYVRKSAKYKAIIEDIKQCYEIKRPVLVGTPNIEVSEVISELLTKEGIEHQVLNAKYHEKESEIIAKAGHLGMITVATNMAGRGTDIILEEGVRELGGLKVIGVERHEARRIDNQLRGRSGRQGDVGESVFYLSLEDDLFKLFASPVAINIMSKIENEENLPIEHKILTKSIAKAQKTVEGKNYEIRKNTLKYDEVIVKHRNIIYKERDTIVEGNSLELFKGILEVAIESEISSFISLVKQEKTKVKTVVSDNFNSVENIVLDLTGINLDLSKMEKVNPETIAEEVYKIFITQSSKLSLEEVESIIRTPMLELVDSIWMSYIDEVDALRKELQFMSYGQKDPHVEFIRQTGELFDMIRKEIQNKIIVKVLNIDFDLIYYQQIAEQQIRELIQQGDNLLIHTKDGLKTLNEIQLEKGNSEKIEIDFAFDKETETTIAKLRSI